MGMYLVSIGAEEWFDEDEGGWGRTAAALNEELTRRGLTSYTSVPEESAFVRGSGQSFEEKLIPPMDGFDALCRAELGPQDAGTICGWTVLVPLSLKEEICLPIESGCTEETVIAGARQVLAIAERLAAAIDLPAEVPAMCDNLDLTMWFRDGAASGLAALRPGRWAQDLDTAFYVALYLRAAQHSLRRGCPMAFS
ncbi:hypothetical protein [Streptacidiphilus rugosus]|uniref:hypothetical protein n=1 Tax=Streptacidiphilus rugosus TaxID=405783 RepID=UPI000563AE7C|nr:hypothetical protein [Streptacidiphilus rugosus]